MPREAHEVMAMLEHLSSLQMLFIDEITKDCTCEWLETIKNLKARNIDIMDEDHMMTNCIEKWRVDCDVSHIHRITLEDLRHRAPHTHEITMDDIQPPVVKGNGTLVLTDGSEYQLNTVEGRAALYKYDHEMQEKIGQIEDEKKRKSFQDMFKHAMTDFVKLHYDLNGGVDGTGENIQVEWGWHHSQLQSIQRRRNAKKRKAGRTEMLLVTRHKRSRKIVSDQGGTSIGAVTA
eukprot:XP_011668220.1 PREDICTED: uncharacterized protein LOC105440122 [Strongylocentrotus purpuratus]